VKFSIRQILASAVGAVLAALIASAFGVKGTVVGVAIGSVAATMGTALVAQSIDRGHEAVKQVVVRAPEDSVLRKLGATAVGGETLANVHESSTPTEVVSSAPASAATDETTQMDTSGSPAEHTEQLEATAVAGTPATQRLESSASTAPMASRRFTWKAIAGTAGVVFLVALLVVTGLELIAGKPLSSIFGHAGSGTSLGGVFNNNSPPPSSTTTTTSTSSSTTTSTSSSTTTTTSQPSSSSTTSSTGGGATTTTSTPGSPTTSTNLGSTTTTADPTPTTS
jgi:hypothetical protein